MAIRQKAAVRPPTETAAPSGVGSVLASYPCLAEWLVLAHDGEGKPRETGTLMAFVEDGRWKCWLHDRATREGCFVSGGSLDAALAAADAAVQDGQGDWRADRKKGGRGS